MCHPAELLQLRGAVFSLPAESWSFCFSLALFAVLVPCHNNIWCALHTEALVVTIYACFLSVAIAGCGVVPGFTI